MESKVQPRFFDGIKFLRCSDLPSNQAIMFNAWVTLDQLNTLNFDADKESDDIIRYEEYDFWFDHHYLVSKDMDELI